jgi:hypothetical protein
VYRAGDVCEWDLCPPCFVELQSWHTESAATTLPTVPNSNAVLQQPADEGKQVKGTVQEVDRKKQKAVATTTVSTPTPPAATAKKTIARSSPRSWNLVKLKLDAKQDSFQHIVAKPGKNTTLSDLVKNARNVLKQQRAQAEMDARDTLKRRNIEHKKRLANVKAKETSSLSKQTTADRKKIARDKALLKKKENDERLLANEQRKIRLEQVTSKDAKKLSNEILDARQKIFEQTQKRKEQQLRAQKNHARNQKLKIESIKNRTKGTTTKGNGTKANVPSLGLKSTSCVVAESHPKRKGTGGTDKDNHNNEIPKRIQPLPAQPQLSIRERRKAKRRANA